MATYLISFPSSAMNLSEEELAAASEDEVVSVMRSVYDEPVKPELIRDRLQQLRDAGVMVISDVVDDEAGWRINRELGMSAIFTNDPAGLVAFLKRSPN